MRNPWGVFSLNKFHYYFTDGAYYHNGILLLLIIAAETEDSARNRMSRKQQWERDTESRPDTRTDRSSREPPSRYGTGSVWAIDRVGLNKISLIHTHTQKNNTGSTKLTFKST